MFCWVVGSYTSQPGDECFSSVIQENIVGGVMGYAVIGISMG